MYNQAGAVNEYISFKTLHLFFFGGGGGGGVPSYVEALWYPPLYFYRKSNT